MKAQKVFVLPDIHFHDRDKVAVAVAMKALAEFGPDTTVCLGDILHNEAFSAHPRSKLLKNAKELLSTELNGANGLLDQMQAHTKRHTYFLEGNHEFRTERWCAGLPQTVAESVWDMIDPKKYLCANRKNFSWVPYKNSHSRRKNQVDLSPRLICVHGWVASANAGKDHLRKARGKSVIFGHSHRAEHVIMPGEDERETVEALNPGCLCNQRPEYADGPTDWTHGIGIAYIGRKSHTLYGCKIEKGAVVLPSGKEVRV